MATNLQSEDSPDFSFSRDRDCVTIVQPIKPDIAIRRKNVWSSRARFNSSYNTFVTMSLYVKKKKKGMDAS